MISIDGLISGIDTTEIITQLMEIQQKPMEIYESRIEAAKTKQTAYMEISAALLALTTKLSPLTKSATFNGTTLSSSNASVMTASGDVGIEGSFSFYVQQLAQASQLSSRGFADSDTTPIGAGAFTIEIGDNRLDRKTSLDMLNGGQGIDLGTFRITDRSGETAAIDISRAVTVQDVLDAINDNEDIDVTASVSSTGYGFDIVDNTGASAGNLIIAETGNGSVAEDLGIECNVAASSMTGEDVLYLDENTALGLLNDGNGVRSKTGNDFTVSLRDGTTSFNVNISSALTVGDVVDAINDASGNPGTLTAAISGGTITLTDTSADNGADLEVTAFGASSAAADMGILGATSGGGASLTLTGDKVLNGMNTVLLRSFNGGSGVSTAASLDDMRITLSDATTFDVDLDGAETLQDVFGAIEAAATLAGVSGLSLGVNATGNGLLITDSQGGAGNISIAALNGSSAASDLGIEKTGSGRKLSGDNVNLRFIGENTLLDNMNGGRGVDEGSIKITDSAGVSSTIDLSQETTLAEVIGDINGAAVGVTASINANGDGLLLTDTAGGSGLLTVAEVNYGTTARDLNILGQAPSVGSNAIDGSYEFTITVSATDTLEDVRDTINDLNVPVEAAIINVGGSQPYRLSLIGQYTGEANQVSVDNLASGLGFSISSEAQDAVLFYGAFSDHGNPLPITSTTNTVEDVVPGMTLSLYGTSTSTVTIGSVVSSEDAITAIGAFVTSYNALIDNIDELTAFNSDTYSKGALFGDSAMRSVSSSLTNSVGGVVTDTDSDQILASQLGLTLSAQGKLLFDSSVFTERFTENRESVTKFFSADKLATTSTLLADLKDGLGVTPVNGDDFCITLRDGSAISVDVSDLDTLGEVIDAINNDSENNGRLVASICENGTALQLVDSGAGTGDIAVTSINGSTAHGRLGLNLAASNSGGTFVGSALNPKGDPGWASLFTDMLLGLTDADDGVLTLAANSIDDKIESYEDEISRMEDSIASAQERLIKEFSAMEQAISESENILSYISAAFNNTQQ